MVGAPGGPCCPTCPHGHRQVGQQPPWESLTAAEAPGGAATGFWTGCYSGRCLISHELYPGEAGWNGVGEASRCRGHAHHARAGSCLSPTNT